jgi:stage III sporulation protein AA
VIAKATNYSRYAFEDEIAAGYIHGRCGVRIGIVGVGVSNSNQVITFKNITSVNIRVPHEIVGCSNPLRSILDDFNSTIIVAPPFAGKTTLIRDMTRVISDIKDVVVIDERDEIAGCGCFRLGKYCDLIATVTKDVVTEGIIRAMSPEIVVMDELFLERDLKVIQCLTSAGIKILAAMHGDSISVVEKITGYKSIFEYVVVLCNKPSIGSIKSITRLSAVD